MLNRRRFLMALASIPFLGSFCSSLRVSAARNYFSELGVRPVINAAGGTVKLTKPSQDSPQNGRSPAIAQLTHVTSLQSEKARARRSR